MGDSAWHPSEFDAELKRIWSSKSALSASRIETLKQMAIGHPNDHAAICLYIVDFIKQSAPQFRLAGVYVIDAISSRAHKLVKTKEDQQLEGYIQQFAALFQDKELHRALRECSAKEKEKIKRTIDLWDKNGIYARDLTHAMDPTRDESSPSTPSMELDAPSDARTVIQVHGSKSSVSGPVVDNHALYNNLQAMNSDLLNKVDWAALLAAVGTPLPASQPVYASLPNPAPMPPQQQVMPPPAMQQQPPPQMPPPQMQQVPPQMPPHVPFSGPPGQQPPFMPPPSQQQQRPPRPYGGPAPFTPPMHEDYAYGAPHPQTRPPMPPGAASSSSMHHRPRPPMPHSRPPPPPGAQQPYPHQPPPMNPYPQQNMPGAPPPPMRQQQGPPPPMQPGAPPRPMGHPGEFPMFDPSLPPDCIRLLTRSLFVGPLPPTITDQELHHIFGVYGHLVSIVVSKKGPICNAFLKFDSHQATRRAKYECVLNFEGLATKVNWAFGFGPRRLFSYDTGESTIPLSELSPDELQTLTTTSMGGFHGQPVQPQMVIEEPHADYKPEWKNDMLNKKRTAGHFRPRGAGMDYPKRPRRGR
ncbi:hypothetical protein BC940DRAFT_123102 [Gongronella butleri]|nr:hypothetical protein BC940DRAFT_123102 [Gongronella butleri]